MKRIILNATSPALLYSMALLRNHNQLCGMLLCSPAGRCQSFYYVMFCVFTFSVRPSYWLGRSICARVNMNRFSGWLAVSVFDTHTHTTDTWHPELYATPCEQDGARARANHRNEISILYCMCLLKQHGHQSTGAKPLQQSPHDISILLSALVARTDTNRQRFGLAPPPPHPVARARCGFGDVCVCVSAPGCAGFYFASVPSRPARSDLLCTYKCRETFIEIYWVIN